MKRALKPVVVILLAVSIQACGENSTTSRSPDNNEKSSTQSLTSLSSFNGTYQIQDSSRTCKKISENPNYNSSAVWKEKEQNRNQNKYRARTLGITDRLILVQDEYFCNDKGFAATFAFEMAPSSENKLTLKDPSFTEAPGCSFDKAEGKPLDDYAKILEGVAKPANSQFIIDGQSLEITDPISGECYRLQK